MHTVRISQWFQEEWRFINKFLLTNAAFNPQFTHYMDLGKRSHFWWQIGGGSRVEHDNMCTLTHHGREHLCSTMDTEWEIHLIQRNGTIAKIENETGENVERIR